MTATGTGVETTPEAASPLVGAAIVARAGMVPANRTAAAVAATVP